ncbi:hypothetical protein BDY24DRAFT_389209 [Mrakia frigida]|uniref:uncharacterized protein n=1 Tax=Mrakia frigida TaxID=29902 RepID=UPI003FCC059B
MSSAPIGPNPTSSIATSTSPSLLDDPVSTTSTMTDSVSISYPPLPTLSSSPLETSAPTPLENPPPPPSAAEDLLQMVAVTVLVISGQRKTFKFQGETTIFRVKEHIYHGWPSEWTTEPAQPPSPAYFRILYRGRMLDDDSTLLSNGILPLPSNRTTIVHLSVRTFPLSGGVDEPKLSTSDEQPRPPLHTRASSRIQRAVGLGSTTVGRNTNSNASASATGNEAARRAGGGGAREGEHGGSGGCGCVVM